MKPDRLESIVQHFHSGFNCAQSVLAAFAVMYDLDAALAARIAAGFGGGIARSGATCGAVTGAINKFPQAQWRDRVSRFAGMRHQHARRTPSGKKTGLV